MRIARDYDYDWRSFSLVVASIMLELFVGVRSLQGHKLWEGGADLMWSLCKRNSSTVIIITDIWSHNNGLLIILKYKTLQTKYNLSYFSLDPSFESVKRNILLLIGPANWRYRHKWNIKYRTRIRLFSLSQLCFHRKHWLTEKYKADRENTPVLSVSLVDINK